MTERRNDAAFGFVVLLCATALASVLWAWGLPLGNDGATHVFQAYVTTHFDDPTLRYGAYYELLTPATAMVFGDIQGALEPLLGWRTAWRVNVIFAAELWAFCFLFFVVTIAPERRIVGLLGFATALQLSLWLGLMPYYYATALGWLALAAGARGVLTVKRGLLVGILVTLAARAHVVPAALTGLALVLLSIGQLPRAQWGRALMLLACAGAPAMWIAFAARGAESLVDGAAVWPPLLDRLLVAGAGFQAGPLWRRVAASVLVGVGLVTFALRWRARQATGPERVCGAMGAVLLFITMVAPLDFGSWQLGGIRALPLAAGLLLLFLPVDVARWRRVLTVAIAAYTTASLAWGLTFHRELRARLEPAFAGLDLPVSATDRISLIPIDPVAGLEPRIVRFAPLIHLSNLYSMARGGMDPYGHHSTASKHRIKLKPGWSERAPPVDTWPPLWGLEGEARRHGVRRSLSMAAGFSELVLYGREEDVALAIDAGFDPELRQGGLLIAHFRGCKGRVELRNVSEPVELRLGWWPSRTATEELSFAPGEGAPQGFDLERFGCGEVWLDVGAASGARCAEAQPGLPVRSVFTRGGANVLACTFASPAP